MGASVAVWTPNEGVLSVRESDPIRCASVLKPAYAWVCEHPQWDDLAEKAVTASDNGATDSLTQGKVSDVVGSLRSKTGADLETADSWGRVMVDATHLAQVFGALFADESLKAAKVKTWMHSVSPMQRFGFHAPMKAGWDMYTAKHGKNHLVTNIVVGTTRGLVTVTSDEVVENSVADQWRERVKNSTDAVVPIHEALNAPSLRELVGLGISRMIFLK